MAGAEGIVRRCVMLVQAAITVDDVDVGDFAFKLFQEFQFAAGQGFFRPVLVGADHGTHVGMASVVEHAEVWVA